MNSCGKSEEREVSEAGFTLTEVIISTVILSLVVYYSALSYSLFLDVWEDDRLSDQASIRNYRSGLLIRYAFESVYDYYVTDPVNEKIGQYYPFFIGRRNDVLFITLSSLFHQGTPALARLVTEDADSRGLHRLVYEECPLDRFYLNYEDNLPAFENRLVVDHDVRDLRIRYFGVWETKFDPRTERIEVVYRWQETFMGKERLTTPEVVEVTIDKESGTRAVSFPVMAKNPFKGPFLSRVGF